MRTLLFCVFLAWAARPIAGNVNSSLTATIPPWAIGTRPASSRATSPEGLTDTVARVRSSSRSQCNEEVFAVVNFLARVRDGFFLEMGALDGDLYSNTVALQDVMGWHGLLIEADPLNYHSLKRNRKSQICVHAAVCDSRRTVHWATDGGDAVRGIWEFMNPTFRARFHPGVTLVPVSCIPLGDLLRLFNVVHVDFFSLDVEGAELAVLQTIDWDVVSFGVLVVEADAGDAQKDEAVRRLLASHGYERILPGSHPPVNDWFLNTRMRAFYAP